MSQHTIFRIYGTSDEIKVTYEHNDNTPSDKFSVTFPLHIDPKSICGIKNKLDYLINRIYKGKQLPLFYLYETIGGVSNVNSNIVVTATTYSDCDELEGENLFDDFYYVQKKYVNSDYIKTITNRRYDWISTNSTGCSSSDDVSCECTGDTPTLFD